MNKQEDIAPIVALGQEGTDEGSGLPGREVRLCVEMEEEADYDTTEYRQLAVSLVDDDGEGSILYLFRVDGDRGFFLEWLELKAALEYLRPLGLIEAIPPKKRA